MSDIDFGAISEALNDKSDRDLHNIDNTAGADAVIAFQVPTAENNYTWYRKYKSGWVEQGGIINNSQTTYYLPVEMLNTSYYVNVCWDGGKAQNFYPSDWQVRNLTTTSFYTTASRNGNNVQGRCWEVKGMAAQ